MTTIASSVSEPAVSRGAGRALPKLGVGQKVGYATGAVLDGVASQAINIFLFFYAMAVCGLPAGLVGFALAAGLVVDAVVDPLIGSASDALHSRFGRRLPFMALGVPGTMLSLVMLFSLPAGWPTGWLVAWLTAASIGLRTSISLFVLPYNAAGAELSDDYDERSSIAAWRWGIGMLAAMVTVLLGFGVFLSGLGGLSQRGAYLPFAATLAALVAVGAGASMWSLHRMAARQHEAVAGTDAAHLRLLRQLGELFRNASFRTLFLAALLLFTASAIHSTLGIHTNTYFWRMSPGQIQVVTLSLFGGLLLGAPLAGPMLRRLEKRTVLVIGVIGLGSALAVPTTLRLVGLLPDRGAPPVTLLAGAILLGGMLMAIAAIAFASMMADAADEHEYLFGGRQEGLYFAGWAFASKAASGFGSLISGLALQVIGFPTGSSGAHAAPVGAAPLQLPPGTVTAIGVIYGPVAGVLALAAAVTCLFYRLDATRHGEILRALAERRGDASRS